ncbi:MAG: DUF4402 domain-containing protein [Endomicrobia bacterium]|nr:DUF4402 domain-containing protein [Endomicrobiia bacterium]
MKLFRIMPERRQLGSSAAQQLGNGNNKSFVFAEPPNFQAAELLYCIACAVITLLLIPYAVMGQQVGTLTGIATQQPSAGSFYKTDLQPAWITVTSLADGSTSYSASGNIRFEIPPQGGVYSYSAVTIPGGGINASILAQPVWQVDQNPPPGLDINGQPIPGLGPPNPATTIYLTNSTLSGAGSITNNSNPIVLGYANATPSPTKYAMTSVGAAASVGMSITLNIPGNYRPGTYTTTFIVAQMNSTQGGPTGTNLPWVGTPDRIILSFTFLGFLEVSQLAPLHFGTIGARPYQSYVLIDPVSGRSGTAFIYDNRNPQPSIAKIRVWGSANTEIRVSFPNSIDLANTNDINLKVAVEEFTAAPLVWDSTGQVWVGFTDSSGDGGELQFTIGGKLIVPDESSVTPGLYTGELPVTINF